MARAGALALGQQPWLQHLAPMSHNSAAADGCSVGLCPPSWLLRDRSPASEKGLCRPLVQDKGPQQAALANTAAPQGRQRPRWPHAEMQEECTAFVLDEPAAVWRPHGPGASASLGPASQSWATFSKLLPSLGPHVFSVE